jgi:hypothetical protein
VSHGLGFLIESLVALLLVLTIGYCRILNSRLKLLKSDEAGLRATIGELVTATEIAERAVAGLKETAHECEQTLGERLKVAERACAELDQQLQAGDAVISRLSRIVVAAKLSPETDPAPSDSPTSDPKMLAAAARAFAERARERITVRAA